MFPPPLRALLRASDIQADGDEGEPLEVRRVVVLEGLWSDADAGDFDGGVDGAGIREMPDLLRQPELAQNFFVGEACTLIQRGPGTIQGRGGFGCDLILFHGHPRKRLSQRLWSGGQHFQQLCDGSELSRSKLVEQLMCLLSVHVYSSVLQARRYDSTVRGYAFFSERVTFMPTAKSTKPATMMRMKRPKVGQS